MDNDRCFGLLLRFCSRELSETKTPSHPRYLGENTHFPRGWKLGAFRGKTAITGQRGEKPNPGKLFPRVSGGYGEMIPPFLFVDTFPLAAGTAGRLVRVHFLLFFPQKAK